MALLASAEGVDGIRGLYKRHVGSLLQWLAGSCQEWTMHSAEILQLSTVLTQSGKEASPHPSTAGFYTRPCPGRERLAGLRGG